MHSNEKSYAVYPNAVSHNKYGPNTGEKKQVWVDKEYPILITVLKRMKEKDLTVLDAYNQVLDLPSKNHHHHTTMSIPLSEKNKENIQPNQVPTAIPQIVN